MKRIYLTVGIILGFLLSVAAVAHAAFPPTVTSQGGTGTTSPSGILYGDNALTGHLNTVIVGSNCTFIGGTFNCTGGGGAGTGTVSTTTGLIAGQVDFSTGVSTIGNSANFLWDNTNSLFTVVGNASTSQFTSTSTTYLATQGGSVGVGTTSPFKNLSIDGGSGPNNLVVCQGAGNACVQFGFTASGNQAATIGTITNAGMFFMTNNATRMNISSTGNVGIATTTSQWPLESLSATKPQLDLYSGSTDNHWAVRAVSGGTLYISTTTYTGTSTTAALAIDPNGYLVNAVIAAGSGSNCLQVDTTGKITNTGAACASSSGSGTVSTSTNEIGGRLPYWTSNSGTPATLGQVATTTLAFSGPFTGAASIGTLVGGANTTLLWTGLATTSQPSQGNLLYSTGGAGVAGVATTSPTFTGPFTTSGLGSLVGGSSPTILWTGLATTSQPSSSNLLVSNGLAGVYAVATTSATINNGLTGTLTTIGGSQTIGLATMNAGVLASDLNATVPTSHATSTFLGPATPGQVWGYSNGAWGAIATSSVAAGSASTTLLADVNTWTGQEKFTVATTTGTLYTTGPFASTTLFFAHGLETCNTGNALTWAAGRFGCAAASGGGDGQGAFSTTTSTQFPNGIYVNGGNSTLVAIGTSTPANSQLTVASSTGVQLLLSDTTATSAGWGWRNTGGTLYLASTSPTTFATTTISVLNITNGGKVNFGESGVATIDEVTGTTTIPNAVLGIPQFDTDAGLVSALGIALDANAALGTPEGITGFQLGSYATSSIQTFCYSNAVAGCVASSFGVVIGTTSPFINPQSALTLAATTSQLTLFDTANFATNPFSIKTSTGSLFIGTSSPTTMATSTRTALWINVNGGINFGAYGDCNGTSNALGITSQLMSCDSLVSDARLKKDVSPLQDAVSTVNSLRPVQFRWKDLTYHNTTDPREQYGFIAQEVQPLIPSAVGTSPDGYLTLDKTAIIPYLVADVQKLNQMTQGAARSAGENWQWLAILLLGLWVVRLEIKLRK